MIDTALKFLRDDLNASFEKTGSPGGQPAVVTFVAGDKIGDSVGFTLGHVCLLLVRLEEENLLRPADPFARITSNGARERVNPEIRLNLHVLFAAHFSDYSLSLHWLSRVVSYFQNHRIFTPANSPALAREIDQLVVELVTLPFAEQNEIWGALRTSYRPSALYRVRMVVIREESGAPEPTINEVVIKVPA